MCCFHGLIIELYYKLKTLKHVLGMKEAAEQIWSVRTLQRNVSSQYYYRMLKTQKKEFVEREMKKLTAPYQNDKLEFIKNPVVAEFLGFSQNSENQSPDFILQVDCIYFSICLYCKQK